MYIEKAHKFDYLKPGDMLFLAIWPGFIFLVCKQLVSAILQRFLYKLNHVKKILV